MANTALVILFYWILLKLISIENNMKLKPVMKFIFMTKIKVKSQAEISK